MLVNNDSIIFPLDDYNNDNIGSVLLTRCSKAIWAKSTITIRNKTSVPSANMLICTNEDIRDLKVEGCNKEEVYKKISVIDLGETPMSSSSSKAEKRKVVMNNALCLRKHLPSFFGVMFQTCDAFITSDEFKAYEDITKHERLANLLKNAKNLHRLLNDHCEKENIVKPRSLANELDTSSLTNKSVMVNLLKSPDKVVEYLINSKEDLVVTKHNEYSGIAFDSTPLKSLPWYKETFQAEKNGVNVYVKMRTRQLTEKKEIWATFLSFHHLLPISVDKVKIYAEGKDGNTSGTRFKEVEGTSASLVDKLTTYIRMECLYNENIREDRCNFADVYISSFKKYVEETMVVTGLHCKVCSFVSKSKGGLTNHYKIHKKK